ncbi:MAG: helix-turn-helix domain-containing protein [Phycisphaerales bacterium]|jgi:excisionase family DNA binding protein
MTMHAKQPHSLNQPTTPTADDRLLRAQEVAQMLAVSTRLVWRFRSEGKLPSVSIARATRFRLSDVKRFMQSGT